MNHMVSHYDCVKQHITRQFNALIVKQCTEVISNIQHSSFSKCSNVKLSQRKKEKSVFEAQSNIDVLTEHSGIITHYLFL